MEFYSERCQDWLNKSQRIHPDKLVMEVDRFKKMYDACGPDDIDAKEDLALTVQLLEERLQADQQNLVPSQESSEPSLSDLSPDAYQLSDTPKAQDLAWDLQSLTDPSDIEVEVLDTKTKTARKKALLNHPSIGLGVSGIKQRSE